MVTLFLERTKNHPIFFSTVDTLLLVFNVLNMSLLLVIL